jgi:hypothetical protein
MMMDFAKTTLAAALLLRSGANSQVLQQPGDSCPILTLIPFTDE